MIGLITNTVGIFILLKFCCVVIIGQSKRDYMMPLPRHVHLGLDLFLGGISQLVRP